MISRPCNLSCWQLGFTLFMISAFISNVDADSIELNSSPTQYYVEDIKAAMNEHVAAVVDDSDIFHIRDDVTNEDLTLKFIQVHDPVREIDGEIYFACTDFHAVGDSKKIYDVDFWLRETCFPPAVLVVAESELLARLAIAAPLTCVIALTIARSIAASILDPCPTASTVREPTRASAEPDQKLTSGSMQRLINKNKESLPINFGSRCLSDGVGPPHDVCFFTSILSPASPL